MAFKQWVLNKKQFDLFVGSMLGDGSIKKNGLTGAFFRVAQVDHEYIDWKVSVMGDNVSSTYTDDRPTRKNWNIQKGFQTKTFHGLLPYKEKEISFWLSNLNSTSFCIWLLDDGWVSNHTSTGNWNIACDRFTDEERSFAIRVIWELFRIQAHVVGKKRKHIAFLTNVTKEINEMIMQNIPNVDIVKRKISKTRVLTTEEQHNIYSKAMRTITEETILLIDSLLKNGLTHSKIKGITGVDMATVSRIRNKKSPYYQEVLSDRVKHA